MENDPICIERDLTGPAFGFNHIEMPLINIVAEMEDNWNCIRFLNLRKNYPKSIMLN